MSTATTAQFAAALADGACVIDVREPSEYVAGHVPAARLVPQGEVLARLRELHRSPVFVICQTGNRSALVTAQLRHLGVDAIDVLGGVSAWTASGRPLVHGPRADVA